MLQTDLPLGFTGAQPQGSKGTSVGHPSEVNYEECVSAVKKVVDEIPKPQHLCSTDIYAVSGYRKLIESVNLINKMNGKSNRKKSAVLCAYT